MSSSTPTPLLADQEIPLRLQLWDGATNKYVIAHVSTDTGIVLAGSPFLIPHVSNGLYCLKTASLKYPSGIDEVKATFVVYNDAGLTTESKAHERSLDLYTEDTESELVTEIMELKELIQTLITICTNNSASAEIVGVVDENDDLTGIIEDEALLGYVDTTEIVGVLIEEEGLDGFIDDTEGLEGYLEEDC